MEKDFPEKKIDSLWSGPPLSETNVDLGKEGTGGNGRWGTDIAGGIAWGKARCLCRSGFHQNR